MIITDVKTILLTGPCTNDPYLSEARKLRSAAFIKIETNTEYIGWGETYAGYFFPEGVPVVVDFLKPVLIGQSVDNIKELWQRMYHAGNFWCRVGLGAIVLAGIEAALWDLSGKLHNKPVYKLLQEVWSSHSQADNEIFPEKILCYATGGPSNYPMDKLFSKIEFYCSLGFKGVKIGAGAYWKNNGFEIEQDSIDATVNFETNKIASIRERFGYDLKLMIDAHMGNSFGQPWNLETALAVANALDPYKLLFLEEPLPYNKPDDYAFLRRNTKVTIAGGECLTTVSEWNSFIQKKCFDVGQPDASFTSGLESFIEVAALLYNNGGFGIAPHAWGAGGSQMQNIHCGFACKNTVIVEVAPAFGPLHSEIIKCELQLKNGYLMPPELPGLGIELTDKTIKRFPFIPGSGEFNSVAGKVLTT